MSGNSSACLERASATPSRRADAAAFGLLAAVFSLLAWWSWGKWTDPHIDFGNELYIAWQLSDGQALYRDIAHRGGPLPHYLNALWFELFGVSIRTLVWCNLAILAAICFMIYRVFRAPCGRATASIVCLVFLVVFGFSQYTDIANYNYVTPYHHHQTHGVALSLAMLLAFGAFFRAGAALWLALAGACLGLVFLTKAELFVPALAAAGIGLALAPAPGGARLAFAAGALLPPVAFTVLLGSQMTLSLAVEGVLGNWSHLSGGLLGDPFYARGAGLDEPASNAILALGAFAALAVFTGVTIAIDRIVPARRGRAAWALAAGALLFAGLALWPHAVPWARLPRALPLATLALASGLTIFTWRARAERDALARWAPLVLFSVWGMGLLGKMFLRARIPHYGFVLAMPATLLIVAGLVHLVPAAFARRSGGDFARALAVAAVAAFALFQWRWSDRIYERKGFSLGSGADAIVAEVPRVNPRAKVLARALARLDSLAPPGATLLVWPEGAGINYWLRRRNPSRYNLFLPVELDAFGREEILADLRAHAPDFVVLVHRQHDEFGVGPFGVDPRNGRGVLAWLREAYTRVERIGAEPFTDQGFGVVILRRNDHDQEVDAR